MKTIGKYIFFLFFLLMTAHAFGQDSDSLVLDNGNVIVGKIKEMARGVVTVKTKYSDSDFKIKWEHVKYMKTSRYFIVYLEKGIHYYGTMYTDPTHPENIDIFDFQKGTQSVDKMKIVYFKEVDNSFLSRLSLDVSLGYSLAKANKTSQLTTMLNTGYLANVYSLMLNYSMSRNFQTVDDTINSKVKRTEADLGGKYYLPKNWFVASSGNFLNSSEQKLKLRATIKAGAGKFLLNNHVQLLSASAGLVWNIENYEDTSQPDKNSLEAYAGIEYNIYNMGDLNINSNIDIYPSLTEKGRLRSDLNFNLKYDFIKDFFINLGFTYNFDNQPVAGAPKFDYTFQTTIGWEL